MKKTKFLVQTTERQAYVCPWPLLLPLPGGPGWAMGCGASCAQRAGRVLNGVTGVGSLGRIADLHDEFTIGQKLGDGAFATAYRGVRKADGCEVAIKTLDRTHPRFEHSLISAEIMVMRKVTHERCIRLIDVLEDARAVHLVEEVLDGSALADISLFCSCSGSAIPNVCA